MGIPKHSFTDTTASGYLLSQIWDNYPKLSQIWDNYPKLSQIIPNYPKFGYYRFWDKISPKMKIEKKSLWIFL